MKTVAIACNTLKDEITLVTDELKVNYPIVWIKSGQHQAPQKLNKAIQNEIDRIGNVENILLLFGSCGNSLYGLKSEEARIIFPRVDDCISLFLGGNHRRKEWDRKAHSYYLTKGYLENESNIWTDFTYSMAKFGEEKARKIMKIILKNYEKLRVVETGAYQLDEFVVKTKDIAAQLGLDHEVVKGSLHILYKALRGEWDDDFVIIQPGEAVDYPHLLFSFGSNGVQ
ncbi:MAG: hypothetical protein CVU89_10845 [Firmicutes bacterium HGW-Firmicutes-14]|nr:MAG: hypothetical protein CVU89_10845 [Firmicutes bacterium HGW-Firmicutes-14]